MSASLRRPQPAEPTLRLDAAVGRAIAELGAAAASHRDTLASLSVERSALAAQIAQAEAELGDSPPQGQHHRAVAAAVEQLRTRLVAADGTAAVADRALRRSEAARDALVAALPGHAPEREGGATRGAPEEEVPPRHLFQVVEDERMRIARDMHDGPAQLLANLVLKAEIVQRCLDVDPGLARAELEDFKQIVRHALEETRQLIFDLRPMTLDDLGLVPTVRRFAADLEERWGLPCRVRVLGAERRLDGELEAALFRIVQEAVNNARQHAVASAVEVVVSLSPTRVTLTVSDDGRGFDVPSTEREAARTNHLGLISMRERASLIGAVLDISSAAQKGTTVRVFLTTDTG